MPRARTSRARGRSGTRGRRSRAVTEERAGAPRARPVVEERADGDVRGREAAVPEDDPLVVALTSRLRTDHDLRQLRVQRVGGEAAAVDVRAERAEPPAPDR